MPVHAYVDGFNLYHSLLRRNPPLKWLDFTALWGALLPDLVIEHTYYFTANVHPMPLDKGAPARQQRLLDALRSSGVEVVLGKFRRDRVMRDPRMARCATASRFTEPAKGFRRQPRRPSAA